MSEYTDRVSAAPNNDMNRALGPALYMSLLSVISSVGVRVRAIGARVGGIDGMRVGADEGINEGTGVGADEGGEEGTGVGAAVGGEDDGAAPGALEGIGDGSGDEVGTGDIVGAAVHIIFWHIAPVSVRDCDQ